MTPHEKIMQWVIANPGSWTANEILLGCGFAGEWAVRLSRHSKNWSAGSFGYFAPGEARFETKEAAQAALDYLRDKGVLKDGVAL